MCDTWYDERWREWRCTCDFYHAYGHCRHLVPFRFIADLEVKEEYL